jgi:hypothetical protein
LERPDVAALVDSRRVGGWKFTRISNIGDKRQSQSGEDRGWNDLCLQIPGEIGVRKPSFLEHFDD